MTLIVSLVVSVSAAFDAVAVLDPPVLVAAGAGVKTTFLASSAVGVGAFHANSSGGHVTIRAVSSASVVVQEEVTAHAHQAFVLVASFAVLGAGSAHTVVISVEAFVAALLASSALKEPSLGALLANVDIVRVADVAFIVLRAVNTGIVENSLSAFAAGATLSSTVN
jgi:hypothetical protein